MEKSKKSSFGFERVRNFCVETAAEMRRCSWPDRRQLIESTLLIVVAMAVLACFVAGVDEIARLVIRWVTVRS